MKFTRQQRINNTAAHMVQELNRLAEDYHDKITNGIDMPESVDGYPALKATGAEVMAALDDNAKAVKTVIEFIRSGKSNQITKPGT